MPSNLEKQQDNMSSDDLHLRLEIKSLEEQLEQALCEVEKHKRLARSLAMNLEIERRHPHFSYGDEFTRASSESSTRSAGSRALSNPPHMFDTLPFRNGSEELDQIQYGPHSDSFRSRRMSDFLADRMAVSSSDTPESLNHLIRTTSMTHQETAAILSFHEELAGESNNEAASLHSKFLQQADFADQIRKGKFGSMEAFDSGLMSRVGTLDIPALRGMFTEHCLLDDQVDVPFQATNASTTTTSKREWLFVVGHAVDVKTWTFIPGQEPVTQGMDLSGGRNTKSIEEIMQADEVRDAGLGVEELIGLRLYSGPMYERYNAALRSDRSEVNEKWGNTITVIVSGLLKLSRITRPQSLHVFRGLSDTILPENWFKQDEQGFCGGVELGFMSTTPDLKVALRYSKLREGGSLPTILKIKRSKTSVGANISCVSQFEDENEVLYPPLTHVEVSGQPKVVHGVCMITLRATVNQHFLTLEEALSTRKDQMEKAAKSLHQDVSHWARHSQVVEECQELISKLGAKLVKSVQAHESTWYNVDRHYQQQFNKIMEISEKGRNKLAEHLWSKGINTGDDLSPLLDERRYCRCSHMPQQRTDNGSLNRCDLLEKAIDCMVQLVSDSKHRRDRVEQMRKDLLAVYISGGVAIKNKPKLIGLKRDLGTDLIALGRHTESLAIFEEVLQLKQEDGTSADSEAALVLNNIGQIYKNQGKYLKAQQVYRQSLLVYEKTVHPDDPERATVLNNLAVVHWRTGRFNEALRMYEEVLQIRHRVLGTQHSDVATTLACIGLVLTDLGDYDTAMEYYKESLHAKEFAEGKEHPDIALTLSNMGVVFVHQGRFNEAMSKFQNAKLIMTKVLGDDHHDVANTLIRIADVYEKQGMHCRALEELESAKAMCESLGNDHPTMARINSGIAEVYEGQGQLHCALEKYREAHNVNFKVFGASHPDVAAAKVHIAKILIRLRRNEEARTQLFEATVIFEDSLGPEHEFTLDASTRLNQVVGAPMCTVQKPPNPHFVPEFAGTISPDGHHSKPPDGQISLEATQRHDDVFPCSAESGQKYTLFNRRLQEISEQDEWVAEIGRIHQDCSELTVTL